MRHLTYLAVLAFVVVGTLPLELFLRTRVYARPRRLLLTLLPVVPLFFLLDAWAVAVGFWDFDVTQTVGVVLPGDLPLEELLFFLVVPVASVLTLEAVRSVRGWRVGDEA
jgi:lycopene cyclase domain-containing protein